LIVEYREKEKETEGLVNPATAARLLGMTSQHLNRIVQLGRIKKHKYENLTYMGMNDVDAEIKRRSERKRSNEIVKNQKTLNANNAINVDRFPEELLFQYLEEWDDKYKFDKDLELFLLEKYIEWKHGKTELELSKAHSKKKYLICQDTDKNNVPFFFMMSLEAPEDNIGSES
jgi:hypothetical protein